MPDQDQAPLLHPRAESRLHDAVMMNSAVITWRTPGTELADTLRTHPEVRLVAEFLQHGERSILVVLDKDPEPLLDLIYETERSLIQRYPALPLALRVTTRPSGDAAGSIPDGARIILDRRTS